MNDVIVVVNAGSSSLKFSLFVQASKGLELVARGQAEGLYTSPRFVAKDGAGDVIEEKTWGEGIELGHAGDRGPGVAQLEQPGPDLAVAGHCVLLTVGGVKRNHVGDVGGLEGPRDILALV